MVLYCFLGSAHDVQSPVRAYLILIVSGTLAAEPLHTSL